MILSRRAKNGNPVEMDIVPSGGLDNTEGWEIFPTGDHYLVALNEDLWFSLLHGVAAWLNQNQVVFLIEAWIVALVDQYIDMEIDADSEKW